MIAKLLEGEPSEAAAATKAIRELSVDQHVQDNLREAHLISKMLKRLNSEEDFSENFSAEIAKSLSHFLYQGYFIEDLTTQSAVQELYTSLRRTEERQMIREVLRCLEILGAKHAVWPKLDLRDVQKLFVLQYDVTPFFLSYLQIDSEVLMDANLHPLRRILGEQGAAAVVKVIDQNSCRHCGFGRRNLLKCSRCVETPVLYCSRTCQRLHWPLHKSTCGACAF